MSYNAKVYHSQGGAQMVVGASGSIKVETGGSIVPNSGTQAAHIADLATNVSFTTTAATAVNDILAALEGVGILATS